MRRRSAVTILVLLSAALALILYGRRPAAPTPRKPDRAPVARQPVAEAPSRAGETMLYDIRLRGVRMGSAVYRQREDGELRGAKVNVIEFETELVRFKDKELIYSDPVTRLPLEVERNIVNFLARERITEVYDQPNFTVTITKHKDGVAGPLVIRKDKPIHNSILLPHFVRDLPRLEEGYTFTANLPTRSVEVRLNGIKEVSVPAGTFKAYHFVSDPRQIEIWISADERRIPVKIQGVGLTGYAMVLREYKAADSVLPKTEGQI